MISSVAKKHQKPYTNRYLNEQFSRYMPVRICRTEQANLIKIRVINVTTSANLFSLTKLTDAYGGNIHCGLPLWTVAISYLRKECMCIVGYILVYACLYTHLVN